MVDFDNETEKQLATPVHLPKRCVSCKMPVAGQRVIVACMCTSCLNDPHNMLGRQLLLEWKGATPELKNHKGIKQW